MVRRYTAEQVDGLVAKLARAVERWEANKSSPVRGKAAVRDLLKLAVDAHGLLMEALKGDKEYLAEVFGGSCERYHRFQGFFSAVDLGDHQQWQAFGKVVKTIEEVLKELGTYRPWRPEAAAPPEGLSYPTLPQRLTSGARAKHEPELRSGEPTYLTFKIAPPLPRGLELIPNNGHIRGYLPPGVELDEQAYVVTASNSAGAATAEISFSVGPEAPASLSYGGVPDLCFTGEWVQWLPSHGGGAPTAWSVEPALPAGFVFNSRTGEVFGVPGEVMVAGTFAVTAANSGGSASVALAFGVQAAPPVSLRYTDLDGADLPLNGVCYFGAEVELRRRARAPARAKPWGLQFSSTGTYMGTKWKKASKMIIGLMGQRAARRAAPDLAFSVDPALPGGMVLCGKTGVITGKPRERAARRAYAVTVSTAGGAVSTNVEFAVVLLPPAGLRYPELVPTVYTGQPISLSPQVQGLVSRFAVSPELPHGLGLDQDLGSIFGIPTEVVGTGHWVVTATNDAGEARATIEFSVARKAPINLAYQPLAIEYALSRPMSLHPSVEGDVAEFVVHPPLPPGLALDPASGVISGTPLQATESCDYRVTALNDAGRCNKTLTFATRVVAPAALSYPHIDATYHVGEQLTLEPQIQGSATSWVVEPELPRGLAFDSETGCISGAPECETQESSYTVSASNEAGGTSDVLTFSVVAPMPIGLSYPTVSDGDIIVGHETVLEPTIASGVCVKFAAEPELPAGLRLDPTSGTISGIPSRPSEPAGYRIVASNLTGCIGCTVSFGVTELRQPSTEEGYQDYAALLEDITDVGELPKPDTADYLNWMVWMVHRAWLNDPSLTVFNFSSVQMPLPHEEPRVAPKLMQAMATNTHITSLLLADSNLRSSQAHQLADSLRQNCTLQILSTETNHLDSDAIRSIAIGLKENKQCQVVSWRFCNQRDMTKSFGRPVEQALAEFIQHNMFITRIDCAFADPHWRDTAHRALIRNIDADRRRKKAALSLMDDESVRPTEKQLSQLALPAPPGDAVWEVFDDDDEQVCTVRRYVASKCKMPTKEQLQSYARAEGKPLPYRVVAPLVRTFYTKLLDAMVGSPVSAVDALRNEAGGTLREWSERNNLWSLDVWLPDGSRVLYTARQQPAIAVSAELAAWLSPDDP